MRMCVCMCLYALLGLYVYVYLCVCVTHGVLEDTGDTLKTCPCWITLLLFRHYSPSCTRTDLTDASWAPWVCPWGLKWPPVEPQLPSVTARSCTWKPCMRPVCKRREGILKVVYQVLLWASTLSFVRPYHYDRLYDFLITIVCTAQYHHCLYDFQYL